MFEPNMPFEEVVFLTWLRNLSEDEQEILDEAVIYGELFYTPPSILSSYPHEFLEVPATERS